MKYFIHLLRVLVGVLFIFSGFIKLNDPTGFSYKLDEYFTVFGEDVSAEQDTLTIDWTFNGQKETSEFVLLGTDVQKNITVKSTSWAKRAIGEGDTLYISALTVKLDESTLFTNDITVQDSNDMAEFTIASAIQNKSFFNKSETIGIGGSTDITESIDVQPYIKANSFLVDFFYGLRGFALAIAILVCVVEVVLGLALLIGWQKNFTLWMLIIMIVFFTFLTWYSAEFNKVTDCGCFGDAIPLKPYESFIKDVILSIAIIILFFGRKHIKPIFKNPFAVKILTVSVILFTGFSLYCFYTLPAINFLKFKKGNHIQELTVCPPDAPKEIREMIFIYEKDGVQEEFTMDEITSKKDQIADGYTFVDRIDKVIQEGCEPPIHDFIINNADKSNDYVEAFLTDGKWKIMVVQYEVEGSNLKSMEQVANIAQEWQSAGYDIYPMTSSNPDVAEAFKHAHQLPFEYFYGDGTNLKSIIRSNPGLLLFKGDEVIETWPSTALPDASELLELTK